MPTAQRRPVLDATTFEMSRIAEAYSRISFPSVRHDSVISSDTVGGGPKQFPVDYQLVVTTSRGVFAWDMLGVTELFKSGSGGIVAAKKLTGDNMSLAVADSQVVILHDVGRSIQKSYRLKSSEGQVRLLSHAGKSSQNLFFTTSLQNSVQAFSLKHSRLLEPHDTHPSPPSVFALSCDSHLLLSTSAQPPTIHLRSLAMNTPPILLQPQCSTSAVVAAAFHPEQQGIFIMAYADGNTAVYDAIHILKRNGRARDSVSVPAGSAGEIASIKGLHTPMTKIVSEGGSNLNGYDPGTGKVSVTANASGTTSVALLPGHKATAVTVGADGKCCVVDFTQPNKKKAVLLKSWHLRRPATSVSVIYARNRDKADQTGAADDWNILSNKDYYVAIGRHDGKVLLFDLDGRSLGQKVLDGYRTRIINVEWAKTNTGPPVPKKKEFTSIKTEDADIESKKLETATLQAIRPRAMTSPIEQDSLFDFTTPRKSLGFTPSADRSLAFENQKAICKAGSKQGDESHLFLQSVSAFNHLDLVSDLSSTSARAPPLPHSVPIATEEESPRRSQAIRSSSRSTRSGSALQWGTTTSLNKSASRTPPPVPPRPTLKAGGRSYMRRAQRARETACYGAARLGARRISEDSSRSHRRISTTTLPRTKVLMGPRPLRKRSPSTSLHARVASERASESSRLSSNALNSLSNGTNISTKSSTKSSTKDYKTASSYVRSSPESEASNDTIVDWSPGIFRQPLPTPVEHPFINPKLQISKKRNEKQSQATKQGHISLSSISSSSTNTICNWPKYKPPQVENATPSELISSMADSNISLTLDQRSAVLGSATALVLASGHYSDPATTDLNRKRSMASPPVTVAPPSTPTSIPQYHRCNCGSEVMAYMEQAFDRLRRENLVHAEGLRRDIGLLFEEQRGWVMDVIDGREGQDVGDTNSQNQSILSDVSAVKGEGKGKRKEM